MDTVKVTHQYKLSQWAPIISECKGSGMTVKAWCNENGVNEKRFYYWQKRVREELFSFADQDKSLPAPPTFAPLIKLDTFQSVDCLSFQPDMVIMAGDIRMEISNSTSPTLLAEVMKVLSHVQ